VPFSGAVGFFNKKLQKQKKSYKRKKIGLNKKPRVRTRKPGLSRAIKARPCGPLTGAAEYACRAHDVVDTMLETSFDCK